MDESITKVLQAVQEEFPRQRGPRRQSSTQSGSSTSNARKAASIPIADDKMLPTSDDLSSYSASSDSSSPRLGPDGTPSTTTSSTLGPVFSTSPSSLSPSTMDLRGQYQAEEKQQEQQEQQSSQQETEEGQQTPRARNQNINISKCGPSGISYFAQQVPKQEEASANPPPSSSGVNSGAQKSLAGAASGTDRDKKGGQRTANTSQKENTGNENASPAAPRSPKSRSGPSFIALPPQSARNPASAGFSLSSTKSDNLLLTPGGDDLPFAFKRSTAISRPADSPEIVA